MSEMPERIYAGETENGSVYWYAPKFPNKPGVEYTRSDLCVPRADVAKLVEGLQEAEAHLSHCPEIFIEDHPVYDTYKWIKETLAETITKGNPVAMSSERTSPVVSLDIESAITELEAVNYELGFNDGKMGNEYEYQLERREKARKVIRTLLEAAANQKD